LRKRTPVAASLDSLIVMQQLVEDLSWDNLAPPNEVALLDYLRKEIAEKEQQVEIWRKKVLEVRAKSSSQELPAIPHPRLPETGDCQASEVNITGN
jgi:hypothetical protein